MIDDLRRRDLAQGEATSKICWGADVEEVLAFLRANYGIDGDEADAIIASAVNARREEIRKKAAIAFAFAALGLGIAVAYFAIQGVVGIVVIGFGPILMAVLGIVSLLMAVRSARRLITGDAVGPV